MPTAARATSRSASRHSSEPKVGPRGTRAQGSGSVVVVTVPPGCVVVAPSTEVVVTVLPGALVLATVELLVDVLGPGCVELVALPIVVVVASGCVLDVVVVAAG